MPHTTLCHAYVSARDDDGGFLGALSSFLSGTVKQMLKMMMNMMMMMTTTMIMTMMILMVFSTVKILILTLLSINEDLGLFSNWIASLIISKFKMCQGWRGWHNFGASPHQVTLWIFFVWSINICNCGNRPEFLPPSVLLMCTRWLKTTYIKFKSLSINPDPSKHLLTVPTTKNSYPKMDGS